MSSVSSQKNDKALLTFTFPSAILNLLTHCNLEQQPHSLQMLIGVNATRVD